jgi:hypothetical protein
MCLRDYIAENPVNIRYGPIQIFENKKQYNIESDHRAYCHFRRVQPVSFFKRTRQKPERPVDKNRSEHYKHEFRFAPRVKQNGHYQKKKIAELLAQKIISNQANRKKTKQKYDG